MGGGVEALELADVDPVGRGPVDVGPGEVPVGSTRDVDEGEELASSAGSSPEEPNEVHATKGTTMAAPRSQTP